ncbi:alpha/beta hydrolase [Enterobacterales bacterium CwR94]|nr:alpha/beta hydrolase [Enterobacterales bacterium CwR94]
MKTEIINVWPGSEAPGASDAHAQPRIIDQAKPYEPYDRAAYGVRCPEIALWYPEDDNGITLLVAPGGGFERVMIDREGSSLSTFFTAMGYTLAVMTYRLPHEGHHEGADAPLADVQRAIRVLRERARQGLNGRQIVMLGFSAGGHVAASAATRFAEKISPLRDSIEQHTARPDALVLIYPVISMRDNLAHKGARQRLIGEFPTGEMIDRYSLETRVRHDTPATLLIHAVDDTSVSVENSMQFFSALRSKNIPVEAHFYQQGGHGFGLRSLADSALASWPMLVNEWLRPRTLAKK